jgi:adenine-specific DNA-methyltransferase
LREDLPDLDFWIGRPVGFGRPSKKFYQNKQDQRPLVVSSWLLSPQDTPLDEPWIDEFESGMTKDGGDRLHELFGRRVFDFPKPVSLVKAILQRISPPDAVVLDFFAGSGTTAEAVLALNAEDDGDRRFILVSNTEADAKNPEKNLCRDVCRERVRRVIQADTKAPPKGKQPAPHADGFAYVRLDLMPSEEGTLVDAAQDPHTAWTAIQIAAGAPVTPWPDGQDLAVVRLPSREDIPERWVAYAPRWSAQIGKAIEALDGPGTLWTDRPGQARQALARRPDVAVEDAPKTLEAWLAPVEPFVR